MLAIILAISCCWVAATLWKTGRRERDLPPGPPTLPVVGNILNLPLKHPHFVYTSWARQYGEIISLKLGGKGTLIILSSAAAVKDILDKRGSSSSDRPKSYIVDLITGGMYMGLANHDDKVWKYGRRMAQMLLSSDALLKTILPLQEFEVLNLLQALYTNPKGFYTQTIHATISIMLTALYGKTPKSFRDELVKKYLVYEEDFFQILEPGALPPVDFLPFLKLVPERFASWKLKCKTARRTQRELFLEMFENYKARIAAKEDVGPCYMENVLSRQDEIGFNDMELAYHAGTLMDGGADAASAFLRTLILMLVAFPECQRKASEEIDHVTGYTRRPRLSDIQNLPYLQALLKEIHRFRPVSTSNIPHVTREELQYKSYVIPRGAIIIMNTWGIYHDPEFFEEPEIFNPERFLLTPYGTKPGVNDQDFRSTLPFGAGRRMCPGHVMAHNMLAITAMNLLWTFRFEQEIDHESGTGIPIDLSNYATGVAATPLPFECKIIPRSSEKIDMIRRESSQQSGGS